MEDYGLIKGHVSRLCGRECMGTYEIVVTGLVKTTVIVGRSKGEERLDGL